MQYLLHAVSSEAIFNKEHSWCAKPANYLQQPMNARQNTNHQPRQHGWEEHFGALLLLKCLNPLPRSLSTICKFVGKCGTRYCRCNSICTFCVIFCHGKREDASCQIIQHIPASTYPKEFLCQL